MIEQAPELLTALETILNIFEDPNNEEYFDDARVERIAREAIAKAKGE